jgi:hypothetical protein
VEIDQMTPKNSRIDEMLAADHGTDLLAAMTARHAVEAAMRAAPSAPEGWDAAVDRWLDERAVTPKLHAMAHDLVARQVCHI